MSATDGAWDAPVVNAVPDEVIVAGGASLTDDRDLFVIHAALLHTGKVLWFCGHTELMHYATVSYVFDPDAGTLTRIPFPPGMDLFCCHYVQMADGRLLVVGGSDPDFAGHGSRGAKNIVIFDPTPTPGNPMGRWVDTGKELERGRWYPTAVLLGDGRVLVFSGRTEFGRNDAPHAHIAPEVEVISPPDFTSRLVTGGDLHLSLYPGLHLAPNGQVFYTHTNWGIQISPEPTTRSLEMTGPTSGKWNDHGTHPTRPRREEGMSVLLPPAQDGKILLVGGSMALDAGGSGILLPGGAGPSGMDHIADALDPTSAQILDTKATPPSWSAAPGGGNTGFPRINGHLVLLPDATVLVCGGHDHYKWKTDPPTHPSRQAEIYTPGTGFRQVASMTHPRMYHSTALLLPDGRVVVSGGADAGSAGAPEHEPLPAGGYPAGWPPQLRWNGAALNRKEREIYRPPYFFKGARPTITDVQRNGASVRQLPYGSTFVIETAQGPDISAVVLMRPGCTTHHTDSEQRYVPLTFTHTGNDLTVTMPPIAQSSVLPPGYYMLWIVDSTSRPCEAAVFVHVPLVAIPAGGGGSTCPCVILTATMVTGAALAPEVVTLRRIRAELASGTPGGARFVGAVMGGYRRVSPPLAAYLRRHERTRVATRDVVVRPGTKVVRAAERATAPIRPVRARHAALVVLLLLVLTGGLAAVPLLAVAMLVQMARGGSDG